MARVEEEGLDPGAQRETKAVNHWRRRNPGPAGGKRGHIALGVDHRHVHGPRSPVASGKHLLALQQRHPGMGVARPLVVRGVVGVNQDTTLGCIRFGQQAVQRDIDKFRVAVILFAVGKGQLQTLGHGMDIVGAVMAQAAQVIALQERQLLQKHRPLAPRAALIHLVATVGIRDRLFDRGPKRGQILGSDQPAVGFAVFLDNLRDFSPIKGVPGCLQPGLTAARLGVLLGLHQAPEGLSQVRVFEDFSHLGQTIIRQIDLGRRRPFTTKTLRIAGNREVHPHVRRSRLG